MERKKILLVSLDALGESDLEYLKNYRILQRS